MLISFADFQKLDLRTGTIVEVNEPEGSEKIYKIKVNLGEQLGERIIFAGLKNYYKTEELKERQIVVLVNLQPRKFFGEEGEGMLLAADEDGVPILLQPEKKVANGTIIR